MDSMMGGFTKNKLSKVTPTGGSARRMMICPTQLITDNFEFVTPTGQNRTQPWQRTKQFPAKLARFPNSKIFMRYNVSSATRHTQR